MPHYLSMGQVPHKRHAQFRTESGDLYHEEVMGIHGFAGIQSILYHLRPPTAIVELERVEFAESPDEEPGPLRPRLLNTIDVRCGGDAVQSRVVLMRNQDLSIAVSTPTEAMSYWYRFAHGDEMMFVHHGTGAFESQFGAIRYEPGDYLIVPTGCMWRIIPDADVDQRMLVVEANGHFTPPRRYLNNVGQFLEHSPFCERDLRPPTEMAAHDESGDFEVRVKSRGGVTAYHYEHHPLDVVGWDGCLWPYALNIRDFEPITGSIHMPPPVHQTFDGPGVVICSFVPRLFDYHPEAIPAPYNHSNVDSDEVLYYVEGNFMSRKGIDAGSMSIHPNGIPHGPHPGTYEGSIGKRDTNELAVMIDTFRPLQVTTAAHEVEAAEYYKTWRPSP